MNDSLCSSCRKPKANFSCEICECTVCKNCVHQLDVNAFSFLPRISKDLKHTNYCGSCFEEKVSPELDAYAEVMDRAKQAFVFFKTQRKGIPLLKRAKDQVKVEVSIDRDDTILRLAFLAALDGYNAIIETDVTSEKIREGKGSYQTSKWRGTAVPAQVDGDRIERQDVENERYR